MMKLKKISITVFSVSLMIAALYLVSGANVATLDSALSVFPFLEVEPGSASTALTIDQNYDDKALQLDVTNARTVEGGYLRSDDSAEFFKLLMGRASTEGTFWMYRNLAAASMAGPLLYIEEDNTGADEDMVVFQNDGEGDTISITNGRGVGIDMVQNVDLENSAYMMRLVNNYDWTGGSGMVLFENTNTGELGTVLTVENNAGGHALDILGGANSEILVSMDYNGAGSIATRWDTRGSGATAMELRGDTGTDALKIGSKDDARTEYLRLDIETSAPAAGDCNDEEEAGRLFFDRSAHRLYVCKGSEGWGYTTIS